jgi:hypothetical protein
VLGQIQIGHLVIALKMLIKWRDVMLNKFYAFIFALSAIFIISCNQNSEVKGDNPKENKVTKEEVTNTKNEKADNVQKWAVKTDPDGRIKHYYSRYLTKPNGEIRNTTKPDDYEWTQNMSSNSISVMEATLKTDFSGIGKLKNGNLFYQNIESTFGDTIPLSDLVGYFRMRSLEGFFASLCSKRVDYDLFKDFSICMASREIESQINNKGISIHLSIKGREDVPFFDVVASGHRVSFTYHDVYETKNIYKKTNGKWERSFEYDNFDLGLIDIEYSIKIDEDKLTYRAIYKKEPGENPKDTITTEKIRITILGPTYSTEDEFFKKLKEVKLIDEHWRFNNTLEPPNKWSDDVQNLLCGRMKMNDPLIGHGTALCETRRKEFNRSPHYVLSINLTKDTVGYVHPGWLQEKRIDNR